jgi:superfamily I DNA/RNA helicase
VNLSGGQSAVVKHGDGPARVTGAFGTGKTAALRERAKRLTAEDLRPLLVNHREVTALAAQIVGRHGDSVRVIDGDEQRQVVVELLGNEGASEWPTLHDSLGDRAFAAELATTVLAYEGSFLGVEELRVHSEAVGGLDRWEELAAFTERYQAVLAERGQADSAAVVVTASLLLRDPLVCAIERERFDALMVDDYQLATFATARLITQLAGQGGNLVVAGNADACIGAAAGASSVHLDRFAVRFGAALDVVLTERFRVPAPPVVHLDRELPWPAEQFEIIDRESVDATIGREWPRVVVMGASAGAWPAPRSRHRWFDARVLGGPDVPDDETRDAEWLVEERNRFHIACSRALQTVVIVAEPPLSPFVADLVR